LTPPVLKWIVNKASPSLTDNEKFVFKLFLAKSTKVVKNGRGGLSIIGFTDSAPIWIIGKIALVGVSNGSGSGAWVRSPENSSAENFKFKLKFSFKNPEMIFPTSYGTPSSLKI